MSLIVRHKPYVPSSRAPQPVSSASQSSSSSQSSSTSQSSLISSGDPTKRLEEAQIKVKAAYAQREKDLATTEELRLGGTNKKFLDMCKGDTDKRFKKALDAIRNEYSDIGFQPEMPQS